MPKYKTITVDSVFNDVPPLTDDQADNERPEKSFYEETMETIGSSFILSIPIFSLRFYPEKYAYMFGTVAYSVMLLVFVAFLYTGFVRQLTQEFISLDPTVGDCR